MISSIIYPPTQDYNYLTQRPQHLMRALASLGVRIIYLNPGVFRQDFSNSPNSNLHIYNQFEINAACFGNASVCYYSYPPHVFQIHRYPHIISVFDSIDAPVEAFHAWSFGYKEALSSSDLVIASSRLLYEQALQYNSNVILVPNGCDFDMFNGSANKDLSIPEDIRNIPSPIIGYFGSVSSWFDMDLLGEVADVFSHCSVVIIGPGSDKLVKLGRPNIFTLGYKPYGELPKYTRLFDVGLIPFRVSDLTEAVNPVKMWEYLAAGIPVVTTDLPEAKGYQEIFHSSNTDQFLMNIHLALNNDSEYKKNARLLLAQKNTWAARARVILEAMEATYLNKQFSCSTPAKDTKSHKSPQRFRSLTVKKVILPMGLK